MGDAVTDLGYAADSVAGFPSRAVTHMVDVLRKEIRPAVKRATGGDSRVSGAGNARLSVTGRTKGTGKVTGTVKAGPKKSRGPWRWIEDGTRPHTTHAGTRRHPGHPGKRAWSKPVDRALPQLERDIASMWDRVI